MVTVSIVVGLSTVPILPLPVQSEEAGTWHAVPRRLPFGKPTTDPGCALRLVLVAADSSPVRLFCQIKSGGVTLRHGPFPFVS